MITLTLSREDVVLITVALRIMTEVDKEQEHDPREEPIHIKASALEQRIWEQVEHQR